MSNDSFERSTLERKDRTELSTIAEALGRKPPSRAKKSEIVDLILDLSGVGSGAEGADPDGNAVSSADGAAAMHDLGSAEETVHQLDAESDDARDRDDEHGEASHDADPRGATPVSAGQQRGADVPGQRSGGAQTNQPPRGQQDRGQQDRGQQGGTQDRGNQGGQPGRNQNGQAGGNQAGGNQAGGNQSGSGANQSGGNQSGDAQGEGDWNDGESGNRRRRRRGRNRERVGGDVAEADPQHWDGEPVAVSGLLDLRDDGYGFLRVNGFLPSRDDVYVPVKWCRQMGLRKGDHLNGTARPAGRQEKNPALLTIDLVNGKDPEDATNRPRFEDLTPLFPDEKLVLEDLTKPENVTARIIDLIAPIGKGQRGLIVSPPKAGKTTIMKTIAQAIERNHPEVHLMVLLIDERPEEVTDFRRSIEGEVVASTFDRPAEEHTMVAELTIEHSKRMVEYGHDVVIILDGITRLSRAYNLAAPATGRIMSGGIDTGALYPPKKFFGAARNVEEGGSLTILATALVETGSTMDTVIFEEFKGTGNMELRLDRRASEKRVYPAIDVDGSSTRHEELLFDRNQLEQVWKLRRVISGLAAEGNSTGSLELLIDRMKTFRSNDAFLSEIAKAKATPA